MIFILTQVYCNRTRINNHCKRTSSSMTCPANSVGVNSHRSGKPVDAPPATEVYDISRFQKVMTKTQMLELRLPSPPRLCAADRASHS